MNLECVAIRSPSRFVALGAAHLVGVAVPAYFGLSVGFVRAKVNLNCVRRGDGWFWQMEERELVRRQVTGALWRVLAHDARKTLEFPPFFFVKRNGTNLFYG